MTAERPTPDSGEPPSAFCPRCLRRSDPAAVGGLVGLCHCSECTRYACRTCWDEAGGDCPSCGFDFAAALIPVAPRRALALPALSLGRPRLRPSIAAAILVVAISLLALTLGGGFRPAGGVNGAMDRQTAGPTADPGGSSPGTPASPVPSSIGTTPTRTAAPVATPRGQQAVATDRVTAPRVTPKPAKAATPKPDPTATPPRTAPPTPDPTPVPATPAPTPDPTPTCRTVPNLVGMTVANARVAWTAAGFTGQLDPKTGQNDKIVKSQNQTAGACLPATTKIRVKF